MLALGIFVDVQAKEISFYPQFTESSKLWEDVELLNEFSVSITMIKNDFSSLTF